MAQVTRAVAKGILDGQGYTDNEVRQLAYQWLTLHAQQPVIPVQPAAPAPGELELLRQIVSASDDGDSDTYLSKHFYDRIMSHIQTPAARPVTPLQCPKCNALWLHWPAEQTGFGKDTLNCRSEKHCDYCEKAGVEQLHRLERVPATLAAPQPAVTAGAVDARITAIEQAIRDYHYALDMRQHGGVAQDRAVNAICNAMGMHWTQGAEAAQAVREPLTEDQRSDIATAAAGFNWASDYVEAIDYVIDGVEQLHGITKGGQHG